MTRAEFKRKYGWLPQGPRIVVLDAPYECRSPYCECSQGKCKYGDADMRGAPAHMSAADWEAEQSLAAELAASADRDADEARHAAGKLRPCTDPDCGLPDEHEAHDKQYNVSDLLAKVNAVIGERGKTRDLAKGERSMARCVRMFNAATGGHMSARDGWLFMVCLKIARMGAGAYKEDDYIDGTGYFALMGEEARTEHLAQKEQAK